MERQESLMQEILPDILQHEHLRDLHKLDKVEKVTVAGLGGENNFMISSLFSSRVIFKDGQELNLIVKDLDQDEETRKALGMDIMFNNEIVAFGGVLEVLGVTDMFPQCYYTRSEPTPVVVMQDIRCLGYRMADSMNWLSKDHILLAARELGIFHGKSYTLKETNRNEFELICSLFQECRYQEHLDSNFNLIFEHCQERGFNRRKEEADGDEETETFLLEIQEDFSNTFDYIRSLIKPSGPLSVLCHGDYTRNNVMYKFDELGNPESLMMLDLQTFRWASPATDLSVFLFLHYPAITLMEEWDEIFGVYYKALITELCKGLGKTEVDLPDCYSLTSMGRDFAEFSVHGYFTASYFLCYLHEPIEGDAAEFFGPNTDPEVVLKDAMIRGGDKVTQALADMLRLVQELRKRYKYIKSDDKNS